MTLEQERWAEALALEKRYGAGAPAYIAQRIGALALAGDEEGVRRFREIAVRFEQLRAPSAAGKRPFRKRPIADIQGRVVTKADLPFNGADPTRWGP